MRGETSIIGTSSCNAEAYTTFMKNLEAELKQEIVLLRASMVDNDWNIFRGNVRKRFGKTEAE